MTKGFRSASARASYMNSKRGYGSLFGAGGFGSSRIIGLKILYQVFSQFVFFGRQYDHSWYFTSNKHNTNVHAVSAYG